MLGLLRRAYAVFKAYFVSEFIRSRGFIYGLMSMALWITMFSAPVIMFTGSDVNVNEVATRIFIGIMLFLFFSTASWDWAAEIRWMINEGRIEYYIASGSGFLPHYLGILPISILWLIIALIVNYILLSILWSPPTIRVLNLVLFIYGFALFLMCLMGYALILGGTMISTSAVGFIVEIINFVLPVATGGLFPLKLMPEPLQVFALLTPFSYTAELIRYSMLGIEPVVELNYLIITGSIYTMVFLLIGIGYFKYQLRKVLREGFKSISMW
ncbi:MAG: ABC transporter permease [Desulfurococcaceae archaeon]